MSECSYCRYYGETVVWTAAHAKTHPINVPEDNS